MNILHHFTSKLWPPRLDGIKIFAIVSPYGLAKEYKKKTLKLYIIPPAAGVAYTCYYIGKNHQNHVYYSFFISFKFLVAQQLIKWSCLWFCGSVCLSWVNFSCDLVSRLGPDILASNPQYYSTVQYTVQVYGINNSQGWN